MSGLVGKLANLYRYPKPAWRLVLAECTEVAGDSSDDVYIPLRRLFDWVMTTSPKELEEAFTFTFDLNPKCTLEVGWHLYGEDYNRGAFMARLRDQFDAYDVIESGELPDHLTNVLPLLDAMPFEDAQTLCTEMVLPALNEMNVALIKSESPFEPLLAATSAALREQFEIHEEIKPIVKVDKSIPMNFVGKVTRRDKS